MQVVLVFIDTSWKVMYRLLIKGHPLVELKNLFIWKVY